jgi:hypothetical protein
MKFIKFLSARNPEYVFRILENIPARSYRYRNDFQYCFFFANFNYVEQEEKFLESDLN